MIMSSREINLPQKKKGNTDENKITKASSSQRTWLGMKDPRIVRVPRCFGGKDRHSKVSTIKGLRDRRIRLSVPTAIQLYDLQEKLGLNQPSKVVDWLLNVTKHEIDKLPPLQMTPGIFGQFPQSPIIPHEVGAPQSSFLSLFDSNMKCVKDDFESRNKCKEVVNESTIEKSNWIKINEEEDHEEGIKVHSANLPAPNSFLNANHSSLPSLSNNGMPFNSYYQWDPSNLSLSHLGSQGYSFQEPYNYNVASLSSSLSLPHAGSPLLVCPSGTPPPLFPPYISTPLMDFDPKQTNQYLQMLSSSSQNLVPNSFAPSLYSISPPVRPFQLNFPSKLLYPQNSSGNLSNKENGGKDCTND